MTKNKLIGKVLAVALSFLVAADIIGISIIPSISNPHAQAVRPDIMITMNVGGQEYNLRIYIQMGFPVLYGTWEVADAEGRALAHGKGEIPGWVWSLARKAIKARQSYRRRRKPKRLL